MMLKASSLKVPLHPSVTVVCVTHRVHGLHHACCSGDAPRVFLQTVGLFVYGLYLDIWLAERDPSTTWRVNIPENITTLSMLFEVFVAIIDVRKYG